MSCRLRSSIKYSRLGTPLAPGVSTSHPNSTARLPMMRSPAKTVDAAAQRARAGRQYGWLQSTVRGPKRAEAVVKLLAQHKAEVLAVLARSLIGARWWRERFATKAVQWFLGDRNWEAAKRLAWGDNNRADGRAANGAATGDNSRPRRARRHVHQHATVLRRS